jgi:hypothetical protein
LARLVRGICQLQSSSAGCFPGITDNEKGRLAPVDKGRPAPSQSGRLLPFAIQAREVRRVACRLSAA